MGCSPALPMEGSVVAPVGSRPLVLADHQSANSKDPLFHSAADELLPFFVTVANGAVDLPTVQVCAPA